MTRGISSIRIFEDLVAFFPRSSRQLPRGGRDARREDFVAQRVLHRTHVQESAVLSILE